MLYTIVLLNDGINYYQFLYATSFKTPTFFFFSFFFFDNNVT